MGLLVLSALYRFEGALRTGVTGPEPLDEEILVHVGACSWDEDEKPIFLDQGVLWEALKAAGTEYQAGDGPSQRLHSFHVVVAHTECPDAGS